MDRRSFLKQASAYALATTWTMTNLEQIFAATPPAKRNETREPGKSMEHHNLGGMEVSAIGLGCLPMVGYYGGKYDKKDRFCSILSVGPCISHRHYQREQSFSKGGQAVQPSTIPAGSPQAQHAVGLSCRGMGKAQRCHPCTVCLNMDALTQAMDSAHTRND